jgi:hypothetical protein
MLHFVLDGPHLRQDLLAFLDSLIIITLDAVDGSVEVVNGLGLAGVGPGVIVSCPSLAESGRDKLNGRHKL